jgi:predicted MPP superfamily phosphohydrolase
VFLWYVIAVNPFCGEIMSRAMHMLTFLGIFACILALSHYYLYSRISAYLQLEGSQRRLVAVSFAVLASVTLLGLPLSRALPRNLSSIFDWVVFPWMGIALLMTVIMVVTDCAWLLMSYLSAASGYDPQRRALIDRSFGLFAVGATAALAGISLHNGMRAAAVNPFTVTIERLPATLNGLKIVQVTDLHIGPMVGGKWLREVVDKVNSLKPDVIAVTGDLVDGSVEELAKHVAPLADLKAPLGVYFITGNHEYYSGVEEWCAHVASLGIRVLRNERVSLHDGLDLAGVDDWSSRNFPGQGANLAKALQGRDTTKALILLAHQPAAIIEAAAHGVDLQLSGHTHGGQIWPFTYLVYLQQPYAEGLHRHKETATQIYVSPGTGFWGPPMRLGTAAEISEITLRAATNPEATKQG